MSDPDRLAERLVAIRARHPGSQPEMVAEIVQAVLSTMSGDLSARETSQHPTVAMDQSDIDKLLASFE